MRSRLKKSPSLKARELPLPRSKRTDPAVPRIPTDPRTWPRSRHAFGWAARHFFARPQSPWSDDHVLVPEIVAACVVRELMLALDLRRFPHRRWADWLSRRAHALYRLDRRFRARMNGPHEREYCYTYLRHWLYIGLHKSGWRYADVLPPEMREGHPVTRQGIPAWKRWRLKLATE